MARKKLKCKTFMLPDGTRKYIYGKTQKEVDEKYIQARLEMNAGVDLKNRDTFGEFAQMWFTTFKKDRVTPRVADQIKRNINIHLMPHLSAYRMRDITPMMCANVFAAMTKAGKGEDLQRKVYQIMRAIFSVAVENGVIYKSPVTSSVQPGGRKSKKKKALTVAQTNALKATVNGRDIEPFVAIVLSTGLRKGEALGLQWDDVNMSRMELTIRHGLHWENNNQGEIVDYLKSDAAYRTVPFGEDALKQFRKLWAQRDGSNVFHGRDGAPLSHGQFRGMWKATEELGIKDLTPHTLRHTAVTNWIKSGLDVKEVQYLAGHATAQVTLDIYADYLAECRYEETRKKVQNEKAEASASA